MTFYHVVVRRPRPNLDCALQGFLKRSALLHSIRQQMAHGTVLLQDRDALTRPGDLVEDFEALSFELGHLDGPHGTTLVDRFKAVNHSPAPWSPYFFILDRRVFLAIPRSREVSRILPFDWVRAAEMSCRS